MENLISITDFVLEQKALKIMRLVKLQRIEKYANFLKQPLELWMFIPCDEDYNFLEKPVIENMPFCSVNGEGYDYAILKYQQAKERVLFKGFEYNKNLNQVKTYVSYCCLDTRLFKKLTIENLIHYNLELTNNFKL
jgi:hypothetical protein